MDDQTAQGSQFSSMGSNLVVPPNQPTSTQIPQSNIPVSSSTSNAQRNNPYIIPIIVNVVGGIIYSLLLVMNVIVLYRVVKYLNVIGPFGKQSLPMAIIPVVALVMVVLANFGFVLFLSSKKKKGEVVNKALLSSLVIAIPPIVVQISMYFLAMYSTLLLR